MINIEEWKRDIQIEGTGARDMAFLILDICRVHASTMTNAEIVKLVTIEIDK